MHKEFGIWLLFGRCGAVTHLLLLVITAAQNDSFSYFRECLETVFKMPLSLQTHFGQNEMPLEQ